MLPMNLFTWGVFQTGLFRAYYSFPVYQLEGGWHCPVSISASLQFNVPAVKSIKMPYSPPFGLLPVADLHLEEALKYASGKTYRPQKHGKPPL